MVTPEMSHAEINHRIIDGCFLGLRERKKSLEEILFKMLLRKKCFREIEDVIGQRQFTSSVTV